MISYAIENNQKVPCTISQIVIPHEAFNTVFFFLVSGDRLYSGTPYFLYVYSLSSLTLPLARFPNETTGQSGFILDNRLYLGGLDSLAVLQISDSLPPPLSLVEKRKTYSAVRKIVRAGNELIMGEQAGFIEIYDIQKC